MCCGDVVLDELEARILPQMGDIFPRAGDEIIQADHFVALGQKAVREVGTDETGRSG